MKGNIEKSIEEIRPFIESVQERDIDLLLFEELEVSSKFRKWFITQVYDNKIKEKEFKGVWHSLSEASGESDLVFLFMSNSTKKYAIFIEDKIDALPQKNQASRYKRRTKRGWDKKITCIVAPQAYIKNNDGEAKKYDKQISYESIINWFNKNSPDKRGKFKSYILREAIEQNRRGYTQIRDPKTTAFHDAYYEYASRFYPELEMKEPARRASEQTWIYFGPKKIRSKLKIVHKGGEGYGYVDLQFNRYGNRLNYIGKILKEKRLLKRGMEIVPTGKSVSLRIETPTFDPLLKFESQKRKVKQSLDAAIRLYKIGIKILGELH